MHTQNNDAIASILEAPPVAENGRHNDILDRTLQLRANGLDDQTIFAEIRNLYPSRSGDRKIPDSEIWRSIRGAAKLDLKPTPSSRESSRLVQTEPVKVKRYEHDGSIEQLPEDDMATSAYEFVQGVLGFKDDEYVWIAQDAVNHDVRKFVQRDEAIKVSDLKDGFLRKGLTWREAFATYPYGTYLAINPLASGAGRTENNVSRFLYTLIEGDNMPKEQQLAIFRKSGLPIVSLVDSGSKSVHALVRIDAANLEEYKERVKLLRSYLPAGFDDSTVDAVRFSRLPGCPNDKLTRDGRQRLIDAGIGAASWSEWLEANVERSIDKTEWFDLDKLIEFDRSKDPDCLLGKRWICRGGSLIVQGYTGIGKSSFIVQMCISFATGRIFFGIKPVGPLKIVYVQAENDLGDFAEAFQDITDSLNLDEAEWQTLKNNFIPGRESAVTGSQAIDRYLRDLIATNKPDMILLDPLLTYFGNDISKQEAASEFFRNTLQPIQNETGVVFVFVHHLGKPPVAGSERQGPSHYHGLGSSDIFNWSRETMTLKKDENGIYCVELGKRGRRAGIVDNDGNPVSQFFVKHSNRGIVWELAEEIKTREDLSDKVNDDKMKKLADYIRTEGIVVEAWLKQHARKFGYTQNGIKTPLQTLSSDPKSGINFFRAHINGSDHKSGVYSTSAKPEDECVTIGASAKPQDDSASEEESV